MKFVNAEQIHKERMKDPKYKKEFDALGVEFSIMCDIMHKRIEKDMTQADLARKIGSGQATISRLEAGSLNASIGFLKRVAKALGAELKISLA
ncbi:MAG: helix-turn-helix transcriptional regulator [Candidatus Paceibacterota bacterium]|jgi:DNA-binding XRE family transcriptional regulator